MNFRIRCYNTQNVNSVSLGDFLLKLPNTLLYVSLSYLRLLEDFLQCEVILIIAFSGDDIIGYLPIAFKHNPLYGTVSNSLPFYGSNGSAVVDPNNELDGNIIRQDLFSRAFELVQERNCLASTFISNPLDPEGSHWMKNNIQYDFIDERIGQITHLPLFSENDLEEDLMKMFATPRPRNIRKARKEGVKVHCKNDRESLNFLYKLHYDNITAIHGCPKEKSFFDLIEKYFNNNQFKVYIAEINGKNIAALLLFYHNQTVEYFTPAIVEEHRGSQPSALIIYQAMLDAIKRGYLNWNWGGTWLTQDGVYDFKKKWGTTDYHYFYYTRIFDKSILKQSKTFFLTEYPYFFVLPFSKLYL